MESYENTALIYGIVVFTAYLLAIKLTLIYHLKMGFFYFASLFVSAIYVPIFMLRPRDVRNFKRLGLAMGIVRKLLGIHFEVRNGDIIQESEPAVIVFNHQNSLDCLPLLALADQMASFVTVMKSSLFYIWPYGLCSWLCGAIFIDRSKPANSYETLYKATGVLKKSKSCKFCIFPEGTRNDNVNRTRKLKPFKKGAFYMAIATQMPIIPVVISPFYFINKSKRFFSQGTVIVEVLPPIKTVGLVEKDVDELKTNTEVLMQAKYLELFDEVELSLPKQYVGFK